MKKVIYFKMILPALLLVLLAPGCRKKFLDTVPDNITSYKDVFTSKKMTEEWLARCYFPIPDMWDQPYKFPWACMSDEVDNTWETPLMNSGAITPDNATPKNWDPFYQAIRLCGVLIHNIDQNDEIRSQPAGEELLKQYRAEARFLRAYYYWLIMKQYGPIPILEDVPPPADADHQIPRSSWDECVAHVLAEMDKASEDLPVEHMNPSNPTVPDPTQIGRITKPVILAVKSQILLYHASPLFNGNTELADFKNLDGKQLFNQTYDANRWKQAADAALAVINTGRYSLYKVADNNPFQAAFLSYRNLFWDGYKVEAIWIRSATNSRQWEQHCAPRNANGEGYSGVSTTQETVDAFRMSNGKKINEENSGYKETGFTTTANNYYVSGTSNMYVGREARFYVNVTFNGAKIPVVAASGQTVVELFRTGNSGRDGSSRNWSTTGYTARKNLHPNTDFRNNRIQARPAMMIRLGEIYLNYVEALNEYDPGNPDILVYLNLIRSRAGLPAMAAGLTQEQMRGEIRLERQIELMYEGHRYFDTRRWKVAGTEAYRQYGEFHGMDVYAGTSLSDPAFHKRVVADIRTPWDRKNYFFPAPQADRDRNKQLVQFPGY